MRAAWVVVTLALIGCALAIAQPRPSSYVSTEAEQLLKGEHDVNGDRLSINLQPYTGAATPTPGAVGRCVMGCIGATPQIELSVGGSPFAPITGTNSCACPGAGSVSACGGVSSSCAGSAATCFGDACTASAAGSSCFGAACLANGTDSTALGAGASVGGFTCTSVGFNAACTGNGQFVLQMPYCSAHNCFVQAGAPPTPGSTPHSVEYLPAPASGTNTAGGIGRYSGGEGTGSGKGGDIRFNVCPPSTPGSAPNTCIDAWWIDGIGGALYSPLGYDIGVNGTPIGHLYVTGISASGIAGTGKVVCVKSDGSFGVCSDQPGAPGTCTCG